MYLLSAPRLVTEEVNRSVQQVACAFAAVSRKLRHNKRHSIWKRFLACVVAVRSTKVT